MYMYMYMYMYVYIYVYIYSLMVPFDFLRNSDAGQAFFNICKRLEGKEVPFKDFGKNVTIWTRFSGLFRRNLQEERA